MASQMIEIPTHQVNLRFCLSSFPTSSPTHRYVTGCELRSRRRLRPSRSELLSPSGMAAYISEAFMYYSLFFASRTVINALFPMTDPYAQRHSKGIYFPLHPANDSFWTRQPSSRVMLLFPRSVLFSLRYASEFQSGWQCF